VTLNVSLRVPDGIVLASDSLSTQTEPINQKLNVTGKCDACGKEIEIRDVQAPPINVPSSTWPYTQKLFPIAERFGLATYGSAFVNGRSLYNHVVELTPRLPKAKEGEDHFSAVSKVICDYFVEQQQKQLNAWGIQPDLLPDQWFPFGFQLVGFRTVGVPEPTAWTHWIRIGKTAVVEDVTGLGCYCSGDLSVVALLWPRRLITARFRFKMRLIMLNFLFERQRITRDFPGGYRRSGAILILHWSQTTEDFNGYSRRNCTEF
jgi:hypothetical protein